MFIHLRCDLWRAKQAITQYKISRPDACSIECRQEVRTDRTRRETKAQNVMGNDHWQSAYRLSNTVSRNKESKQSSVEAEKETWQEALKPHWQPQNARLTGVLHSFKMTPYQFVAWIFKAVCRNKGAARLWTHEVMIWLKIHNLKEAARTLP